MDNISIWQKYNENNINNSKFQTINTDILIIGGGIAGLVTTYMLSQNNQNITLIDKNNIGNGITNKTTAKITFLQGIIYQTLQKNFNIDISKTYYNSQKEAIKLIEKIINDNKISCDFKKSNSILFTIDQKNISKIIKEKEILKSFGENIIDVNNKSIKKGFSVDNTYVFNPIKFLNGLKKILKKKINIYENVLATKIKYQNNKFKIITDKGTIIANKIIIACHYPFFTVPMLLPLKTYIKREYVCAGKTNENKDFNAINIDKNLHSIRYYDNYLIYTSNEHKLTNKINYENNYVQSINDFKKYFNLNIEYNWMNQDIVSNDYLPFIGKIKNNFYILTSFNTWGMTNATIGAKIINDLINNKENEYQKIFNPNRINFTLIKNSFLNIFSYLKVYIVSLFKKNNPYYIKIKGVIYGIYVDENKQKHKVKLICPHLKCNLIFNNKEKTWDCPCHGSRFDIDGKLIYGPSTKNIDK
ncbi:MAG: FAD-dependent oxidoreductase [Bacilli bacterium]